MARIVLCVIVWRILASVRERRRDVCVGVCGFEKWREKVEPATTHNIHEQHHRHLDLATPTPDA